MDYIVSVKGVSKSYGEVQALKDVCFEVKTERNLRAYRTGRCRKSLLSFRTHHIGASR